MSSPAPNAPAPVPPAAREETGVFSVHATVPIGVIAFYLVLLLLLAYASTRPAPSSFPYVIELIAAIMLLFLARTLSTRYSLDADALHAWRLFGSRRIRLEEVRKIEFANLRDLGPVSVIGGWGWRGRMWSPIVGSFDSISTVSSGLFVTAGGVPLFLSPSDPGAFARELSRRVRSYTGPLEVDVGALAPATVPAF